MRYIERPDSVREVTALRDSGMTPAAANLANPPSRGVQSETAPPANPGPIATEPKTRPEAVASAATPTHPERFATARPRVPVRWQDRCLSLRRHKTRRHAANVVSIYGQPDEDRGTYQIWANDGHGMFMVSYLDNVVEKVEAYSTVAVRRSPLRAHGQADELLKLSAKRILR